MDQQSINLVIVFVYLYAKTHNLQMFLNVTKRRGAREKNGSQTAPSWQKLLGRNAQASHLVGEWEQSQERREIARAIFVSPTSFQRCCKVTKVHMSMNVTTNIQ